MSQLSKTAEAVELEHGQTQELWGGVEVRVKGDWIWSWHLVVPIAFAVLGIFKPNLKARFYSQFATTLGDTIYVPTTGVASKALIAHELVHVAQDRANGWRYRFGYLLSKRARFGYELQAYAASFESHHRDPSNTNEDLDRVIRSIAASLSDGIYGHMTDYGTALAAMEMVALAIRNDEKPDFDVIKSLAGAP